VVDAKQEVVNYNTSSPNYPSAWVNNSLHIRPRLLLSVVRRFWLHSSLVQIEQSSLLLEVLDVQGPHEKEVVDDQEANAKPLQLARRIHAENDHEAYQLKDQSRLEDAVIA
jgi:hypothetical protein